MFLLFRSRWVALIFVVLVCIRVAIYGVALNSFSAFASRSPSEEAAYKEAKNKAKFDAWVDSDNNHMSEYGSDPSRPDLVRDGMQRDPSQDRNPPYSNSNGSDNQ